MKISGSHPGRPAVMAAALLAVGVGSPTADATLLDFSNIQVTQFSMVYNKVKRADPETGTIHQKDPKNALGTTAASFFDPIKLKPTDTKEQNVKFTEASTVLRTKDVKTTKNKGVVNWKVRASSGYDSNGANDQGPWKNDPVDGWPFFGHAAVAGLTFRLPFKLVKENKEKERPVVYLKQEGNVAHFGEFLFGTLREDFVTGIGKYDLRLRRAVQPVEFKKTTTAPEFTLQEDKLAPAVKFLNEDLIPFFTSKPGQADEEKLVGLGRGLADSLIAIFTKEKVSEGQSLLGGGLIDDNAELKLEFGVDYFLDATTLFGVTQWDGMWGEFAPGLLDKAGNLTGIRRGQPMSFSVQLSTTPIFEPSSLVLLGFGCLSLLAFTARGNDRRPAVRNGWRYCDRRSS